MLDQMIMSGILRSAASATARREGFAAADEVAPDPLVVILAYALVYTIAFAMSSGCADKGLNYVVLLAAPFTYILVRLFYPC